MSLYSHGQRLNDLEQRVAALEAVHLPSTLAPKPLPDGSAVTPVIGPANTTPRYANVAEFIKGTQRVAAAPRGYCTIRTYKLQVTSKPNGRGELLIEGDATSPEFMHELLTALNIETRVALTLHAPGEEEP